METSVSRGRWVQGRWRVHGHVLPRNVAELLRNRKIAVIGDSTTRNMAEWLIQALAPNATVRNMMQSAWYSWQGHPAWYQHRAVVAAWDFAHHECDPYVTTSGCIDCVCTCVANGNATSCMGRFDGSDRTWLDWTAHHREMNITVEFSWKPELMSVDDQLAFRTRWCRNPPHILVVGKGLHGASFSPAHGPGLAHHELAVSQALRSWSSLLTCLPRSSLVVVRTPLNTHRGVGPCRRDDGTCHNEGVCRADRRITASLNAMLNRTRNVMLKLAATGTLGPVRALDGFRLTSTDVGAPRSEDGVHYPSVVQELQWRLIAMDYSYGYGRSSYTDAPHTK